MTKLKKLFGLLTCIYLLMGCNNSNTKTSDTPDFNKLVTEWNKAHNSKDVTVFAKLYNDTVLFYGTPMNKNACIESKLSLFKKYPDFYEQIYGNIQIENLNDSSVRCNFIKRVTVNQTTKDYPAYLTLNKTGNSWKITTESDLTTDKNLAKKAEASSPINHETSSAFVTGLHSATVYTKNQAENGAQYKYLDGRTFNIKFFFEQTDIMFYAVNENDQQKRLDTKFSVGYTTDGEIMDLKQDTKFLVGQYDFDGDDIDELIIALQDNDKKGNNGVCLNIFKLENDHWNRMGDFSGETILGEPIAEVKLNKITVPRHLHGFYYQWTLESGQFKDTGDY